MPLYAYVDPETGVAVELRRPVEDRDKPIVLRRAKSVPDRIGILGFGPSEDQTFSNRMLRQYHRKEEREGSRFRSSYSKKQIQKAWQS